MHDCGTQYLLMIRERPYSWRHRGDFKYTTTSASDAKSSRDRRGSLSFLSFLIAYGDCASSSIELQLEIDNRVK
jgi:hypothetical protein